jgi:hypothetical protein
MYPSYYSAQKVYEEQMRDEKREVATRQMLREAGLLRQGLLARTACRMLCGLGERLVQAGQALQRRVAVEAPYNGGTHARYAS